MPATASSGRTTDRLLLELKMRGPRTAAELAQHLDITSVAARQHLRRLAADGLVAEDTATHTGGRPARRWTLTGAGSGRFPDTHAAMTVELITSIRDALGDAALEAVVDQRFRACQANYAEALAGLDDIDDRVRRLAALRDAEGYMAEVREDADGTLWLIENHCPIGAAARACRAFCNGELDLFREALGADVDVTRREHLLEGGRRCAYRIRRRVR